MFKNYIKIACKILKRNKLFTLISLFGVSFTLTILIIGASFFDYFTKSNYPTLKQNRILYVNKLHVWEKKEGNTYYNSYQGSPSYYLLNKYVRSLKTPERVSIISRAITNVNVYRNNKKINLEIRHTDHEFWNIMDFSFIKGRPFNQKEEKEAQTVAVLSQSLAKILFGNGDEAIGKTIEADNINYKVIGVVRDVPVSSFNVYSNLWVPLSTSKNDLSKKALYGECSGLILANKESDFKRIQNEFQCSISKIEFPFDEYRHIDIHAETVLENFLAFADFDKKSFYTTLCALFLIILAIPSLNLINLNITRIKERESEIGIRKSFGSPILYLVWQFLIENIVLTVIGGIIAFIFSLIILKSLQSTGIIPSGRVPFNYRIFFNGTLFCLLFSFISGIIPALRMSKLQIVKTLQGGRS